MNEPMHTKCGSWWAVMTVAVAIMLMVYIGSYFVLTGKTYWVMSGSAASAIRTCRYPWTAGLYKPLAAEEAFTGDDIYLLRGDEGRVPATSPSAP